jgi:osmoprotectant transport system ATP-binding protein
LVRSELQVELKRICNQVKKTVVLVTHDINEAAFFGHTISLFHDGCLIQHGNFSDFIKNPSSEFVTRFINAQAPSQELLEMYK